MATNIDATVQQSQSASKSKKHKKKKSKAANVNKSNGNTPHENGVTDAIEEEHEEENDDGPAGEDHDVSSRSEATAQPDDESRISDRPAPNARRKSQVAANGETDKGAAHAQYADPTDTANRLDAAVREREQLRDEVKAMRQELEALQQRHESEIEGQQKQLSEAQIGRQQADTKYQKLLGQVNNIKTQLNERLKADAAELEQARIRIDELHEERKAHSDQTSSLDAEVTRLKSQVFEQAKEIDSFRGRTNLSQQNWAKERDDLLSREAGVREEFEAARQAMQDWEVLAMEERSLREGLSERVAELEDQFSSQRDAYDRAASERDSESGTVDSLQRALEQVHEARREERRELIESSQAQQDALRTQLATAEASLKDAQGTLSATQADVARVAPLEKESKEKTLLIGKLRHEAVILNDHLTKALRFLKRAKPDDNVDRQLVSNHFLQFLALDRSDAKKFQILQLISALLGWNEEQKEQAGLARPGASTGGGPSLKVPLSAPFRRVSSSAGLSPLSPTTSNSSRGAGMRSPSFGGGFENAGTPARGEGLAELWSEFLEREAEEGSTGQKSRRGSVKHSSGASTPQQRQAAMSPRPREGSPGISVERSRLDSVGED